MYVIGVLRSVSVPTLTHMHKNRVVSNNSVLAVYECGLSVHQSCLESIAKLYSLHVQ